MDRTLFSRARYFGPILCVGLAACGRGPSGESSTESVDAPLNIGDASDRHGDPEVLIYYANETAPDDAERANFDSIVKTLKSDEKTAYIAESLETDLSLFPLVVDQETATLKDYFCSEKNRLGVSLVIFTNRLTRAGLYEYCAAGQPAQTKSDTYMSKFRLREGLDFRALSNPLADKETLRWALARTRLLFSPSNHIYSFVMKSHGNSDYILTPRLHVIASKISPSGLLKSLKSTLAEGGGPSDDKSKSSSLEQIRRKIEELQKTLAESDAKLEELFKNELSKNELFKNELFKNELFKNELAKSELFKNELFKNELFKNELFKNELLKNELFKNELFKNELFKNELFKNELLKNELFKNELFKNELSKNELAAEGATAAEDVDENTDLAKAVYPRVGVTKREFLAELAATGSRSRARNDMYFSTVFTEACRSYLPWDLKMDIADSASSLKIDYLASSDEGSVKYQNIDYGKFLNALDESKSFGENLKDELARIAAESRTK